MTDVDLQIDEEDSSDESPENKPIKAPKQLPDVITYKKPQAYIEKNPIISGLRKPNNFYEQILVWTNPAFDLALLKPLDLEQHKIRLLRTEEVHYLNSYGLQLFSNLRLTEWKSMS